MKFKESVFKLELSQSLWKNFLGRGTRLDLESAQLKRESIQLEILNQAESWVLGLVSLYFKAWLEQKNALLARENLNRKRTLLKSTLSKFKRGTAEEPEKIQIESSVELARIDFWNKEQQLRLSLIHI